MTRRGFLQKIGSILAILGFTPGEWLILRNRYYQALAVPNSRKLALLIGINQYPQSPALVGCVTDVELQKELLIHRFGFASADILTLTEEQASREFIEAAILDHLGKQAKAEDIVVFHFSGYGSRIKLGTFLENVQNALIPVDPTTENINLVNYLLEENLLQLLRSLPTERVIAVLDTSYHAKTTSLPSGVRIRARPEPSVAQLALKEIELFNELQKQKSVVNNATVLKATSQPNQLAAESSFSGFTAGLFTYALTQYLWEVTPPTTIQITLSQVSSSIDKLGSEQQPALLTDKKKPENLLITDYLPIETTTAQGVIKAKDEDGKTVQLWLGGIPPHLWQYYGLNSKFTLPTGEKLILKSRNGLTAKAQISIPEENKSLQVGQLIQEAVRVLPRNINLTVALDSGLERIERVDATSAIAAITRTVNIASPDQTGDYLFGKVQNVPSRYALFSVSGDLIVNTSGEIGEAVKVAIQRLTPKFSTLLAAKLWRLTQNQGSSRLPVKASLEIISQISSRVLIQQQTSIIITTEGKTNKTPPTAATVIPTVPIGARIQYRVQNFSDRPIYIMLLGFNNNSSAIAFYPWQIYLDSPQHKSPELTTSETKPHLSQIVIPPGETLKFPQTDDTLGWLPPIVSSFLGSLFCEHQLIFSTSPFTETLAVLETGKSAINFNGTVEQQSISSLLNPLEVAQALLQDLHNASKATAEINGTTTDSYVLDVNNWASLNFSFQVV